MSGGPALPLLRQWMGVNLRCLHQIENYLHNTMYTDCAINTYMNVHEFTVFVYM